MKLGFKVQGLPPIQTGRDDTFRIPHQRHFRFARNNVLKSQTNPQWRGLVFNRTMITQKMDQLDQRYLQLGFNRKRWLQDSALTVLQMQENVQIYGLICFFSSSICLCNSRFFWISSSARFFSTSARFFSTSARFFSSISN